MKLRCIEQTKCRFAPVARTLDPNANKTPGIATRPRISVHHRLSAVAILAFSAIFLGNTYAVDPPDPPLPPNVPPTIVDFTGTNDEYGWTFTGQVLDENPGGLVITFGGVLAGHQTTVESQDGYFEYEVEIQGSGAVTAYTVDDHQQGSDYAVYYVQ